MLTKPATHLTAEDREHISYLVALWRESRQAMVSALAELASDYAPENMPTDKDTRAWWLADKVYVSRMLSQARNTMTSARKAIRAYRSPVSRI